MIEEAIIKPIEDYMAGNGELHRFPTVQSARDCCRTGLQTELHNLSSRRDFLCKRRNNAVYERY